MTKVRTETEHLISRTEKTGPDMWRGIIIRKRDGCVLEIAESKDRKFIDKVLVDYGFSGIELDWANAVEVF